jgi:hypothetical protein
LVPFFLYAGAWTCSSVCSASPVTLTSEYRFAGTESSPGQKRSVVFFDDAFGFRQPLLVEGKYCWFWLHDFGSSFNGGWFGWYSFPCPLVRYPAFLKSCGIVTH